MQMVFQKGNRECFMSIYCFNCCSICRLYLFKSFQHPILVFLQMYIKRFVSFYRPNNRSSSLNREEIFEGIVSIELFRFFISRKNIHVLSMSFDISESLSRNKYQKGENYMVKIQSRRIVLSRLFRILSNILI